MRNKKIIEYLLSKGVKPNLKGFIFLHDAIAMTIENGGILPQITKVIQPEIANFYGETKSAVERAMRTAIERSRPETKFKTNGQFVAEAALYLLLKDN